MSSKRKRNDLDDSDEDEPTLGKQVLPVANLPADFSGDPEDGLQYLFMVRRDARTLPHVTRAANPYEIKEEPPAVALGPPPLSTPHSALPSESWREVFVSRFRNMRKNVLQPTARSDPPPYASGSKLMPDMKNRDAWWAFLTGRPESEWNPPKKPKRQKSVRPSRYEEYGGGMRAFTSEYEVPMHNAELSYGPEDGEVESSATADPTRSLPTPFGTPPLESAGAPANGTSNDASSSTTSTASIVQPEPTPLLLRDMDHRYSLHLLMYFSHWISLYLEDDNPGACTITETHGRWMFALLSRVDDYLSADEMSTLRSLARGCMGLIKDRLQRRDAQAAPDVEAVGAVDFPSIGETSCWLIIAAVVGLWGQRDLWQDAESMLANVGRSSAET